MFLFLAVFCGVIGCSGLDRMGRKADMATQRLESQKPVYEGRLQTSKKIGALIAIQFVDGQSFEVVECPADLLPGDTSASSP